MADAEAARGTRYRLTVEYDGGPFVGWQRQDNGPSVQGALEAAGLALTGEPAPVAGAGRTDAGVHALAMTAQIDLCRAFDPHTVREALNAHLRPAPVSVLSAEEAPEGWHARFSCGRRRYLYRILDRRPPPALDRARVWHVRHTLDADAMQAAARALIGRHDFTTFRSVHCQSASPEKSLDEVRVARVGDELHLSLSARSFLHNQVRSIAGTLERVGAGAWPVASVGEALAARDRSACGPVAPSRGLYFVSAHYGED